MTDFKLKFILAAAVCCLLAGCGSSGTQAQTVPTEKPVVTAEPSEPPQQTIEPSPEIVYRHAYAPDSTVIELVAEDADDLCLQRDRLTQLKRIRLTEPIDGPEALQMLAECFPAAEIEYSLMLAGMQVSSTETELDLSRLDEAGVPDAIKALELLPAVERIKLSGENLSLETVAMFEALPSSPVVDYGFTLFGREFNTADESMILSGIWMGDEGAAVREILPYMTNCTLLEMERCNVSNESMAALRDDFPDIKVVWRVNFSCYTCRTDETRILASIKGVYLNAEACEPLKYCTDVKYLDLGHNCIENISFVEYMPELEVCIVAINYWTDASPLAKCEKLEYLEIFNTGCTDLTPLSGLSNLKHLNVCWLHELSDISPLYGLTGLERLWIGCVNKVPAEQLEEIAARLPDTVINTTTENPTEEGWRDDPRYELLTEQMGYNLIDPYSTH